MAKIPPPPPTDEGLPAPLHMNEREKALRDTFVAEYLVDFDGMRACMRCGFPQEFAIEWSRKLLAEPYVQRKISRDSLAKPADEEESDEFDRRRVKARLLQEANYFGPGSSHAARVAALAKLAKLMGMEKDTAEVEVTHLGGVMRVPAPPTSLDAWEAAATASQSALTDNGSR